MVYNASTGNIGDKFQLTELENRMFNYARQHGEMTSQEFQEAIYGEIDISVLVKLNRAVDRLNKKIRPIGKLVRNSRHNTYYLELLVSIEEVNDIKYNGDIDELILQLKEEIKRKGDSYE